MLIYPHHPNHLLENPHSNPSMMLIVHNADQKAPEVKAELEECWSQAIVRADKLCSPNHQGLTPVIMMMIIDIIISTVIINIIISIIISIIINISIVRVGKLCLTNHQGLTPGS